MGFSLARGLEALQRRGRLRSLKERKGLDFASNDYLALAESGELKHAAQEALARGVPVGAGGSRLLRGNHEEHEALEAEAAAFFGSQTALYFGGGYHANHALFSTLPRHGDLVVYDELIHASTHEGMNAGRAECVAAPHNNANAIEDAIKAWRTKGGKGEAWIAAESLYSMDGDRAPLADLMGIADTHGAMLVIDDAHATGALGREGRGLAHPYEARSNVISLHTCGKALGTSGALLCGAGSVREFLINRARSFIYATAPSPLLAAVTRAALDICKRADDRRAKLQNLVSAAEMALQKIGVSPSGSHIQPVIVGADRRALDLAERMQAHGYDIRAIRPPTVPEGTARLRIALTLHADEAMLARMFEMLGQELKNLP